MRLLLTVPSLLMLLISWSVYAAGAPCGDLVPCEIDGGRYYISTPPGWDGKTALAPAIYFHGHSSSGLNALKNKRFVQSFHQSGYVLIAPDGAPRAGRKVLGWPAFPPSEGMRDDIAFVHAMLDDVARSIPLKMESSLVTGFSSGGSMAWYLACYSKRTYGAVLPVAGGLRRPLPASGQCPGGPRKLIHIHGFADLQVPLEGRGIRQWHQGDVFEALNVMRKTNGCVSRPSKTWSQGKFQCREWTGCSNGRQLAFCLHPGGHWMPKEWKTVGESWLRDGSK
ncbi:MAG: alpha/beta hydrolase family esterase [Hyphomicrobiaceae bacterium]